MTAMARRSPALATVPAAEDNILRFDEAPEFTVGHAEESPIEDMDQQVREAQHRLTRLRAEQEELEHQRKILENLKQKQERFIAGRKDITEKLDRSLRVITDDLEEARRRAEDLAATQQDFRDRLEELKVFYPERWHRNQLDQELDKAISALIEAETSFEKGIRRVTSHRAVESAHQRQDLDETGGEGEYSVTGRLSQSMSGRDDLLTWARRGFAFTLPLMVTVLIAVILAKLMF
jgi:molecular chaperone GrpE (heat shock protein)